MKKPASICDLHIHSKFSDGSLAPREIASVCRDIGLYALSVTDHDTLKGQKEALESGVESNIEVLTGIEFSAREEDLDIHILGYLIDPEEGEINSSLEWLREERKVRIRVMIDKLRSFGIELSYEDISLDLETESVGRPHIARALMEMGIVDSFQEAFNRFIGFGRKAYVPSRVLSMERIVNLIRGAGGVAVWAHPGRNIRKTDLLERLISFGIGGIEVWHPNHDSARESEILEISRVYDLIPTGGSDFHSIESMKVDIGEKGPPRETVERLKEASRRGTLS
jgi:predicted metal-dependent phosphoesterase TrpH